MGNKSKIRSPKTVGIHWKNLRNMRDAGSPIFVMAPRREVGVIRQIWDSAKSGPRVGSFGR